MLKQYKIEITLAIGIFLFALLFITLFNVLAPFVLALILAFATLPAIQLIQKLLKNQSLSTAVFLAIVVAVFVALILVFAAFINRDFKRLNDGMVKFVHQNENNLDKVSAKAKKYIAKFYDSEKLAEIERLDMDSMLHSITNDESTLDFEEIKKGFNSFSEFVSSNSDNKETSSSSISFISIFTSSIAYYILILFNINYFNNLKKRYLGNKQKGRLKKVNDDFRRSFFLYFKLRTKIVLLLSIIYFIAFLILDMPGIILFTLFIILLSYIPYLQYLMLIPIAMACFILSIETNYDFIIYFSIMLGVFVLASLIEELWLSPKIMESNMGMNPAIMVLALSIGNYLFGLPGLLLGIPLTSLGIIYIKRYFLESLEKAAHNLE